MTIKKGTTMEISNRRVMISGANRGIGWALAREFAGRRAALELLTRAPLAPEQQQELARLGAIDLSNPTSDLADFTATEAWLTQRTRSAPPDILINNAGLLTGGLLEEQDMEDIRKMFHVNVVALVQLTRAFLPQMLKSGRGVIVNNASVSGIMAMPCATTYAASKSAVVAFSEALRSEVAGTGVNVLTLITPGVKTRMFDQIFERYGRNFELSWLTSIPPEEWAKSVAAAIERGETVLMPSGVSRFGVWLAQHSPSLFGRMVRSKFHR